MPDHIKIPDVDPIIRYLADGEQTVFEYPFPIFASEDLIVSLNGAQQISGFTINGAGNTAGGTVTFDTAPAEDSIITLTRILPIERVTDYLEGGDFSAASINTELDYIIAALQQVDLENNTMLRYSDDETPGNVELPAKPLRANKALGFDGDGNPVAVSLEGSMAAPDFTATGTGASTRTSADKFGDIISVKDFGAAGDGLTDDTAAIQNALAAHNGVYLPPGTYLITGTLSVAAGKSLYGTGQASILECSSNAFNAIEIPANNVTLQNFRIENGLIGIKLFGSSAECTQNIISNIQIIGAATGIQLDGYTDSEKPCYWNNFRSILIEQPTLHGVHLTKSGIGDTPNANRFYNVRVYSKGASTTGSGFYVEYGALNNSFIDCEANINGSTGDSCFRAGANSNKTLIINLLTEGNNGLPNVKLDSGSVETGIINLSAESDGAAIDDSSGGSYTALNAGSPEKNTLPQTLISNLKSTHQRYDTEFIEGAGTYDLNLSHTIHLVNASTGAIDINLPAADEASASTIFIKKVDSTGNLVTIRETDGDGPDGRTILLGGANDYVEMISNGSSWYIISSNRLAGNTRFVETTGTYDIDMAVDTYICSSFAGALTMRLPPANASEAIGRTVTIKKTDVSSNNVTVSEQGGSGPDQSNQTLSSRYDSITVTSDGGQWYIVARYP